MKKATRVLLALGTAAVIGGGALLTVQASGLKDYLPSSGNQVTISREEYDRLKECEKLADI